jgi:hypothetical protein
MLQKTPAMGDITRPINLSDSFNYHTLLLFHIIIIIIIIIILHCGPVGTFDSLSVILRQLCFLTSRLICNFASINICLHTVPPSAFWSSSLSTSLRITVNYLSYSSFTIKPSATGKLLQGSSVCSSFIVDVNLSAPCILYIGQAFRYSPENAFYIFNQQIYFIV